MQHKIHADAGIVPEGGIGFPLPNVSYSDIASGLLEEGYAVDQHIFRCAVCRRQRAMAGICILSNDRLQVFFTQVGSRRKLGARSECPRAGFLDAVLGLVLVSDEKVRSAVKMVKVNHNLGRETFLLKLPSVTRRHGPSIVMNGNGGVQL